MSCRSVAITAWLSLWLGGCFLQDVTHLVFLPGDVARQLARREPAPDPPPPDAGRLERLLHEQAHRLGRPELLRDTRDPEDDPKGWARACDRGAAAPCVRLAPLLVYFLAQPEVGIELWMRACQAGVVEACSDAADVFARERTPFYDAAMVFPLYERACTTTTRRPHACRRLAEWSSHDRGEPTRFVAPASLRYLLLDRACELGDRVGCERAREFFRYDDPEHLPVLRRYAGFEPAAGDGEPRSVPAEPGGDGSDTPDARAKRRVYEELLAEDSRTLLGDMIASLRSGPLSREDWSAISCGPDERRTACEARAYQAKRARYPDTLPPIERATGRCVRDCGDLRAAQGFEASPSHPWKCACGCLVEGETSMEMRALGEQCVADLERSESTPEHLRRKHWNGVEYQPTEGY